MSELQYEQTRSFNVGIAQEVSIEAALIYDDLAYAQRNFGNGWFYRSYEMLEKRFPFMKERTMRTNIKKLVDAGYIRTKIMKVDGVPTCHYQICRILSAKIAETMESAKFAESIYNNYKTTIKSQNELGPNLLILVNKVTGRGFRALPQRGWKQTLEMFTMDEIERALTALARDEWHKSKLKEFKIDYLIRPTTIDKFLSQAKPVTAQVDAEQRRREEAEEFEHQEAFRQGRRDEWEAHKKAGTLSEYREKYGDPYHVDN